MHLAFILVSTLFVPLPLPFPSWNFANHHASILDEIIPLYAINSYWLWLVVNGNSSRLVHLRFKLFCESVKPYFILLATTRIAELQNHLISKFAFSSYCNTLFRLSYSAAMCRKTWMHMSTGKWRRLFHGFILQYHIDQPQFSVENNAGSRDQERLFFSINRTLDITLSCTWNGHCFLSGQWRKQASHILHTQLNIHWFLQAWRKRITTARVKAACAPFSPQITAPRREIRNSWCCSETFPCRKTTGLVKKVQQKKLFNYGAQNDNTDVPSCIIKCQYGASSIYIQYSQWCRYAGIVQQTKKKLTLCCV